MISEFNVEGGSENTDFLSERSEGMSVDIIFSLLFSTNNFSLARLSEGATTITFRSDDGSEQYIIQLTDGREIRIGYN